MSDPDKASLSDFLLRIHVFRKVPFLLRPDHKVVVGTVLVKKYIFYLVGLVGLQNVSKFKKVWQKKICRLVGPVSFLYNF